MILIIVQTFFLFSGHPARFSGDRASTIEGTVESFGTIWVPCEAFGTPLGLLGQALPGPGQLLGSLGTSWDFGKSLRSLLEASWGPLGSPGSLLGPSKYPMASL